MGRQETIEKLKNELDELNEKLELASADGASDPILVFSDPDQPAGAISLRVLPYFEGGGFALSASV